MTETPEWLTVGARVAAVVSKRGAAAVTFAKVDRIGKRDVVLDDGQRFNAARLERNEGGTWGWRVVLMAADDPFVTETLVKIRAERIERRARVACDDFQRRKPGLTAFDVILALAPLTGVADEIAALDVPR